MAEPEYPVLQELETKLKLLWVDTDDVMATQRAIIQVEPELAYLELPRGRKGDKGDPGPAISIQGIVAADSQLPASAEVGHAYVNTSTKGLAVWNGSQWFKVDNFAGVDADVQQFSRWIAQIESDTRRAADAAERAEFAAEETIQQVEGDFATRNYVDTKADASTVDDLAAVTTGIMGVTRRNSRRIQELVSELATKPDNSDTIDELSALVASVLGVGKRNATRISQLVAELAGKADQSALTAGLSTKADKAELSTLAANTLDALEAQDTDIQTAITTASTASTTAQNAEARVAAVEAVADLSPESPVDGQTASLISQPDSLTKAAVTAAVGAAFQEDPAGSGLYTLII